MLPTRASTRRSWTSSPNRDRISAADRVAWVAPSVAAAVRRRRAACRAALSSRLVASGDEVAGHAEQQPVGDAVETAVPDEGARRRRRRELAAEADPSGQGGAVGNPRQEGVGALVDGRRARRTVTCAACRRGDPTPSRSSTVTVGSPARPPAVRRR